MWRFFLPWFWPAEDRVVLGSTFWQFGFPSFVPWHFFLLDMGLGFGMEWAEASRTLWPHSSPLKSCCPAPRAGRRILTSSSLNHGRLSLVSLWVGFFGYLWHAPDVSAYEVHHHQCFLFGDNADRFGIRNVYSMTPLWSGKDLEVEGSLGNWTRVILLDIPSLNCVWWAPPDFILYIRHPERTTFHIH